MSTMEFKVKMQIGELTYANMSLATELEATREENAKLKQTLVDVAAKAAKQPEADALN